MATIKKDLLSIADLSYQEIWELIERAVKLKKGKLEVSLEGKTLALVFEKPSLRTRVSFEVAMRELGGEAIYLSPNEVGLGKREPVADVARTLSRYVQAIALRTFSQKTVEEMAYYATIPIINALSDHEHPCQALGDLLTIYEKKAKLQGIKIAFIGDANNVANSLILAASIMGMDFVIASPPGYQPKGEIVAEASQLASQCGAHLAYLFEPEAAVEKADIVYTDVWVSMGQEVEMEKRRRDLAHYQVNQELLSLAKADALVMHPLPAHHGEEIAEGLLESTRSIVFDQAENRLHIQKAILIELLK